jgi:hypothetical protein
MARKVTSCPADRAWTSGGHSWVSRTILSGADTLPVEYSVGHIPALLPVIATHLQPLMAVGLIHRRSCGEGFGPPLNPGGFLGERTPSEVTFVLLPC